MNNDLREKTKSKITKMLLDDRKDIIEKISELNLKLKEIDSIIETIISDSNGK